MAVGVLLDDACVTHHVALTATLQTQKQYYLDQGYAKVLLTEVKNNRNPDDFHVTQIFWEFREANNAYIGKVTTSMSYGEHCELQTSTTDPNDPSTIDYANAAEFWGFAFVTIMSFYIVSKNIGLILEAVKKW